MGQVRVDADGGDHRRGRVGGVRALGLGAQRADLARRVLALQRGQVDHRDRGVERPLLSRGLDPPAGRAWPRAPPPPPGPRPAARAGTLAARARSASPLARSSATPLL